MYPDIQLLQVGADDSVHTPMRQVASRRKADLRRVAGLAPKLFALLVLAAQPALAADGGMTLVHVAAHCNQGARRTLGTRAGDNIIANFRNADIRAKTQSLLAAMRSAGAEVVRSLIWIVNAEDPSSAALNDQLGMLRARGGKLPPDTLSNIVKYVTAVRDAGFKRFYLVIAPRAHAGPKCKVRRWGDCFDPSTLPLTWSEVSQVVNSVKPLDTSNFHVYYDIGLEMCYGSRAVSPSAVQLEQYVRYMLTAWQQSFHNSDSFISCSAATVGRIARVSESVPRLVSLYREIGVTPAVIDIHVYSVNPDDIAAKLSIGDSGAQALNVPLTVLETSYDNHPLFDQIGQVRSPPIRDVVLWPKQAGGTCAFDSVLPPDLKTSLAQFKRQ